MPQFLVDLLVKLWDKFKAKNAQVATYIILALGAVLYFADQGQISGAFDLPSWVDTAVQWATTVLLALQGSRTSADLAKQNNS